MLPPPGKSMSRRSSYVKAINWGVHNQIRPKGSSRSRVVGVGPGNHQQTGGEIWPPPSLVLGKAQKMPEVAREGQKLPFIISSFSLEF